MYSIYRLTNEATGRTYIGSTKGTLKDRLYRHNNRLQGGVHPNTHLLRDYQRRQCRLTIELLDTRSDKKSALTLETALIQVEDNPYNIRTSKKGAMLGYNRHAFNSTNRVYAYAEVQFLRRTHTIEQTKKRMGISGSMVSMITNGHRLAAPTGLPVTSFLTTFTDQDTEVQASRIQFSDYERFYREQT